MKLCQKIILAYVGLGMAVYKAVFNKTPNVLCDNDVTFACQQFPVPLKMPTT